MLQKFAKVESVLEVKTLDQRMSYALSEQAGDRLIRFAASSDTKTNDGYLYVRCRAISSRVNKNNDGWPSEELMKSYETFIGKPIFVDHNNDDPKRTRGVIVDAQIHVDDPEKTSALDPYYASAPENHKPPTWIELLMEIDGKTYPKLAKAIQSGEMDAVSMGANIEKSICSVCANEAATPSEYCSHVKQKGMTFEITSDNGERIKKKAYEDCYGIGFFEISNVFDPADETADSWLDKEKAAHLASRATAEGLDSNEVLAYVGMKNEGLLAQAAKTGRPLTQDFLKKLTDRSNSGGYPNPADDSPYGYGNEGGYSNTGVGKGDPRIKKDAPYLHYPEDPQEQDQVVSLCRQIIEANLNGDVEKEKQLKEQLSQMLGPQMYSKVAGRFFFRPVHMVDKNCPQCGSDQVYLTQNKLPKNEFGNRHITLDQVCKDCGFSLPDADFYEKTQGPGAPSIDIPESLGGPNADTGDSGLYPPEHWGAFPPESEFQIGQPVQFNDPEHGVIKGTIAHLIAPDHPSFNEYHQYWGTDPNEPLWGIKEDTLNPGRASVVPQRLLKTQPSHGGPSELTDDEIYKGFNLSSVKESVDWRQIYEVLATTVLAGLYGPQVLKSIARSLGMGKKPEEIAYEVKQGGGAFMPAPGADDELSFDQLSRLLTEVYHSPPNDTIYSSHPMPQDYNGWTEHDFHIYANNLAKRHLAGEHDALPNEDCPICGEADPMKSPYYDPNSEHYLGSISKGAPYPENSYKNAPDHTPKDQKKKWPAEVNAIYNACMREGNGKGDSKDEKESSCAAIAWAQYNKGTKKKDSAVKFSAQGIDPLAPDYTPFRSPAQVALPGGFCPICQAPIDAKTGLCSQVPQHTYTAKTAIPAEQFVKPLDQHTPDGARDYEPQSDMTTAPQHVDTLRSETRCPICRAADMQTDPDGIMRCPTCGHVQEPEPIDNPDLSLARDVDLRQDSTDVRSLEGDPQVPASNPLDAVEFSPMQTTGPVAARKDSTTNEGISKMFKLKLRTSNKEEAVAAMKGAIKVARAELKLGTNGIHRGHYDAAREAGLKVKVSYPEVDDPENFVEVPGENGVFNLFFAQESAAKLRVPVSEVPIIVEADTQEDLDKFTKILTTTVRPTRKSRTAAGEKKPILPADAKPSDEPKDAVVVKDEHAPRETKTVTVTEDIVEMDGKKFHLVEVTEGAKPDGEAEPTEKPVDTSKAEDLAAEVADEKEEDKESKLLAAFKIADMAVDLGLIAADNKMAFIAELEDDTLSSLSAREDTMKAVKSAGLSKSAKKVPGLKRVPRLSHTVVANGSTPNDTPDEAIFL